MSYSYAGITNSATGLIAKFGKLYNFVRTSGGSYNPATGTLVSVNESFLTATGDVFLTSNGNQFLVASSSPLSDTTFSKYACLFNYSAQDRADGTVLAGDRRMLVESGSYEVGDKVTIGADTYQVISVSEIAPSGDVVAANLQVRK